MARPKGSRGGKKAFKDPNKPKRAMSAYFFFMQAHREACKAQNKDTSKVAEFTKEASKLWREMGSTEKQKYEDKSLKAKKEYERQMATYVPPKGMKVKRTKDPNKPKRPPTSYILFLNEFREKNKHHLSHRDVMVKAGENWRDMSSDQKHPFEQRALEEKKIYDEKVANMKNGAAAAPTMVSGGAAAAEEEDEEDEDDEEEDDEDEEDDDDE